MIDEVDGLSVTADAGVIFHEGLGMSFFTESSRVRGRYGPTATTKAEASTGSNNVALWGEDNAWPQKVVEIMKTSDLLRPLQRKHAKRMMGQGLVYGTTTVNEETGEEKMKVMRVPEIEMAFRRTNMPLFLYEQWCDFLAHGTCFPELQTDYEGNVVGLYSQDATRCRLSLKDSNGRSTQCMLSGAWDKAGGRAGKDVITLPALDPYFDVAGQIKSSKQSRFILPIRLLVDDNDYYGEAPWHGLIHSGWLDVAKAIPQFKIAYMKNVMLFRYHIEIAREYWDLQFPGFFKKPRAEQKKIKEDVVDGFTKWASGIEKGGKTLMTEMLTDELKKDQYRSLWKINQLKLELPTGAYIEDSAEVDAKIIRAFMDSSLFAQTPSKDRNSSGSGSDKRVAHTQELIDNFIDSELLLTSVNVMFDVNGWHEKYGKGEILKVWFKSYHTATLDRTLGAISEQPPKPSKPTNPA